MKKKLNSPFLKREARVELVSLMDVMFLVLVFFVYSIFDMAVHRGLKVDLPTATGTLEKGERVVVTINAQDDRHAGERRTRGRDDRRAGRTPAQRPPPATR